jgi:hypothetical protein
MVLLLEHQRRQQPIGEFTRRPNADIIDEELTDRYSLLYVGLCHDPSSLLHNVYGRQILTVV